MSAAATPQVDPSQLPPPPAGYTLDTHPVAPSPQVATQGTTPDTSTLPPPPAGYTLDAGVQSGSQATLEDPSKVYLYTTPEGTPVYGDKPFADLKEGAAKIPAAVKAGYYDFLGGTAGLESNVAAALDKAAGYIANLTGTEKGGIFKHLSDYFSSQAPQFQQAAEQASGGRKDLESQIIRGVTGGALQLPTAMVAAEAGGPVAGFAGLGALEQSDKGWLPALQGAVEGALSGGFLHILGPSNRMIRVPAAGLYSFLGSKLAGDDNTTALAKGTTMGLFTGSAPGGAGVRQLANANLDMYRPVSPETSAAAQNVIRLSQKYNVPLTAGDITQSPALKNMEVSLEKVPGVGMQKLREGQQENVRAAAAGIKSLYEEKLLDTDQSSLEELQTAAAAGDERARNVMEKMQNAGNDPDRIIQASIGLGDWTTRQTAKELYDHVQQLAEEHNLGDVPLDATGKSIGAALQQLRPAKLPNKEVIGLLSRIRDSITPELDEEGEPVVDEQGNPVKPDNSYGLIRQLHSDLGERIREYYQGNNALIGEKGVGYLERVQNALEDDMRNYAQNSNVPEIVDAGREADGYYKRARVPYKNGMLAAAATSNEPDQIFQQFIKAGKGDRAQNFYNALDDKGRAAVRYNMVSKAVDDSVNPQSGIFSPQKFFTAVDKLDDAYGVFFNAKDKAEIQGFKNLMGHVIRAGQYAENPPTGQRVIPILMGIAGATAAPSVLAHPLIAGGGAAVLGMTRALFTTARGRNLLLRLNGIKPGTPVADSVWQQVGREMPKLMAPPKTPPQ